MAQRGRPRNLRVVAALIRDRGQVLLTQRRPGRHLGLSWEFPGGKVEAGEDDEQALRRELREELGVEVRIGTLCFETRHNYGSREMHLSAGEAFRIQGMLLASAPTANVRGHFVVRLRSKDGLNVEEYQAEVGALGAASDGTIKSVEDYSALLPT